MLLSFPYLHPSLWSGEPLEGLTFFDPGLVEKPFDNGFRPDNLPLDFKNANALINDCINFGEQFKDPSEMAYFGAVTADDFYEGSSMSIQAQLTERFTDVLEKNQKEREEKEARSKAQFVLLLAWFFEERMIELQGLEQGVKDSWKSMDKTMGVEDEDRLEKRVVDLGSAESHTGGVSDGQTIPLPWKRVIEALPGFIPEGTVLVCGDKEVQEAWEEYGIEFSQEKDGLFTATLPAWKFAGRRRAPEDMPLALRDVTVAVIK
ncbi:hypothetical protein [Pseudodesulfovibrio sediminis]|uniref:Uncharacterized protein n=1 Tax=Pseudodesulfovibrio sediminis TaxID=2810563 RepID=A0ABN6ELX2_9BACT|nr:hypothetical protein [Pseudodesulfovibrio sediminis]BCS87008.1 hypothetical protein PSDVSF_02500 [Pseudodesulfovibrio sediminis]